MGLRLRMAQPFCTAEAANLPMLWRFFPNLMLTVALSAAPRSMPRNSTGLFIHSNKSNQHIVLKRQSVIDWIAFLFKDEQIRNRNICPVNGFNQPRKPVCSPGGHTFPCGYRRIRRRSKRISRCQEADGSPIHPEKPGGCEQLQQA